MENESKLNLQKKIIYKWRQVINQFFFIIIQTGEWGILLNWHHLIQDSVARWVGLRQKADLLNKPNSSCVAEQGGTTNWHYYAHEFNQVLNSMS